MKDDRKLAENILEYCNRIEEYTSHFGSDAEDFYGSKMFQDSCAFCILQIGESVRNLSQEIVKKSIQIYIGEALLESEISLLMVTKV